MSTFLLGVVVVLFAAALGLFVGGIISAARENARERRELGYVTRPGWQSRKRRTAAEIARLEAEDGDPLAGVPTLDPWPPERSL